MFGGAATFLTPLSFHIPQILGIIGADLPCGPSFYQIQDRKKMVLCLACPVDLHGALRRGKGLEMDRKLQWPSIYRNIKCLDRRPSITPSQHIPSKLIISIRKSDVFISIVIIENQPVRRARKYTPDLC